MKTVLFSVAALAAYSLAAVAADQPAAPKVKYTLVKVVDRDEKESFQVLDSAQLSALQDEIKTEERLFDKALMQAEKAWKADESTKSKTFPRSAIGHRSCSFVNSYIKREDAEKAMTAAEEKVARAEENRLEAEKKRDENRRKMGNNNNNAYVQKKKDPKKAEAERRSIEDQALNLFSTKLADLKAGKPEAKEPAAEERAAEPKDAKAQDPKAAGAAGLAGVGGMKK